VFGSDFEVLLRDIGPEPAAAVFADVGAAMQRIHVELHPWQDGALMRLNAALAEGRAHRTTEDIARLIERSQRFETTSQGAFNPAIGALVRLWGFHTSVYPITDPPPDPERVAALAGQRASSLDVTVDGRQVRGTNGHVQFDFSGIAKGLAVQRACEIIAGHGPIEALVNAGGDVLICRDSGRPWRVAIRDPDGGVLEALELARPVAVFTSGHYARYREFDGQRYPHILDPARGRPVDHLGQATVIDSDPLLADAAATALVVAGPKRWRAVAESMGLERVLFVDAAGSVDRLGDGRSRAPNLRPPGAPQAKE